MVDTTNVNQSVEIVDALAKHLGNAANTLAEKFAAIVSTYGPDAGKIIKELGRIAAINDFTYFLMFLLVFIISVVAVVKQWNKYDVYTKDNTNCKYNEYHDSLFARLIIYCIVSGLSFLILLFNAKLATIYGIFSPEAYLILKMLKW